MKIVFAGTPEFAADHLSILINSGHEISNVFTQPDRRGKRGKNLIKSPVKRRAEEYGLNITQPNRIAVENFRGLNFDLIVVVAFGQILSSEIIALPSLGCINVHASLLPKWRGAAPIPRSILSGDKTSGITIMQMDAGLDTGNILLQESIHLENENAGSLTAKLSTLGRKMLIEALGNLEVLQEHSTPQNNDAATYAKKISKSEGLIDWSMESEHIDKQIRAFSPSPAAFSFIDGIRTKILSATEVKEKSGNHGQILELSDRGLTVGTKTNGLRVTALQINQGKGTILRGGDILNGWSQRFQVGKYFKQI